MERPGKTILLGLNESYQDYMRDLNSVRAEELMKTKKFLLFKDHLIEYLRSFVKSLQLNAPMIEQQLRKIPDAQTDELVSKVTSHIMSIPQIDTQRKEETVYETILGSWKSIREWFTGSAGQPSEASRVFDLTNISSAGLPAMPPESVSAAIQARTEEKSTGSWLLCSHSAAI